MTVTIDGSAGVTTTTGAVYNSIQSGSVWTYTSGTPASIDFTGIPAWVKRVTVMISGLSYAAAGTGTLQIGSGSLTTSGYTSNSAAFTNVPAITMGTQTAGFGALNTAAAATTINGIYILTLANAATNNWVFSQQIYRPTDLIAVIGNGFIALGAGNSLDRLSIVASGSTFDAGTINILYE